MPILPGHYPTTTPIDMEDMLSFSWVLPVSFLPGIAILILSTINKRINIHENISNYIFAEQEASQQIILIQQRRLQIIHRALTLLYSGVASFTLSSFLGGLIFWEMGTSQLIMMVLLCGGILSITIAAFLLIYESHLATKSMMMEGKLIQQGLERRFHSPSKP